MSDAELKRFGLDPAAVGKDIAAVAERAEATKLRAVEPPSEPNTAVTVDTAPEKTLVAAGCTVVEKDSSVPRCYVRDAHGLVFDVEQG